MITIGITGTLGAGKGTIVDYLIKNKGFVHYSVRSFITEEINRRGLPVNRDSMTMVGNDLRAQHSPSWIVEQLYGLNSTEVLSMNAMLSHDPPGCSGIGMW